MKKIGLYIMILLTAGIYACSEDDYSAPSESQSNPQESALQSSSIHFTAADLTSINLADLIAKDEPISLGIVTVDEGAMPANTVLQATIDFSRNTDLKDSIVIDCESMENSNVISVLPSTLQAVYYNNFTHSPNQATVYFGIKLYTVTNKTSKAFVGSPNQYLQQYTIAFTPANEKDIHISTGYYAMRKGLDGKWVETKFSHSDKNVYDDPVFTATIDATKNESGVRFDTEYFIVSEEELSAFKEGNLSLAFGKGEGESLLKGGNAFVGDALDGASKYDITINMEKQTIVIEPQVFFYYYYIFGVNNMKPGDGETAKNYMFYKLSNTEYTYTTFWPNNNNGTSIYNLKIAEHIDFTNSSNHWGTARGKQDESGNLVQKATTFGPKTEGWYTLNIVMDEENNTHTYKWTAIDTPNTEYTYISIIGTINGTSWDADTDLTQCKSAPHNWYLLNFTLTADAKLKFRTNHTWKTGDEDTVNKDWGGDGSQSISKIIYTLPTGNSDITVPAGTYDFYLNDITGNWSILRVEK